MKVLSLPHRARFLLVLIILAGADAARPDVGDFARSAYVQVQASGIVGPAGGVVEVTNAASPLYGSRVAIPAGALSAVTQITIYQVTSGSGYPGDVLVTDIEPYNLKLALPARVTLKYSPQYLYDNGFDDPSGIKVQPLDERHQEIPGEMLEPVARDSVAHTVSFSTPSLGAFVPSAFSVGTLNGTYTTVEFAFQRGKSQPKAPVKGARLPVPNGFVSGLGRISFNGAGQFTGSQTSNEDGTLSTANLSGNYTVSAGGSVNIAGIYTGQVLSGGSVVILYDTNAKYEAVDVGIKKSGTFSAASVKGTYAIVESAFNHSISQPFAPAVGAVLPTPNGFISSLGTISFTGTGGFTLSSQTLNFDGHLESSSASGAYTVSSSGGFAIPASDYTGQVLLGGGLIVAYSTNAKYPAIDLLVKKGGTFTNASLSGNYAGIEFAESRGVAQGVTPAAGNPLPEPRGFYAGFGTFDFTGTGHFTGSQTRNEDGKLTSASLSGTYSVNSSGVVTITGGETGQVLAGGNIAILYSNSTVFPAIAMAIKQ